MRLFNDIYIGINEISKKNRRRIQDVTDVIPT